MRMGGGETREGSAMRNHCFYRSLNIDRENKSNRLRQVGNVARIEEGRSAFKILKPTGERPLGRPRHRQENIRTDIKDRGISTRNWIDFVQNRDYWRS